MYFIMQNSRSLKEAFDFRVETIIEITSSSKKDDQKDARGDTM